jgi:hypothetical protein
MQGSGSGTAGAIFNPTASLSITDVTVSGGNNIAGMVGLMSSNYQFTPSVSLTFSSDNTSSVSGTGSYIGGLFGRVMNDTNSSFTLNTTTLSNAAAVNISAGTGSDVGGIFGSYELAGTTFDNLSSLSNTGLIGNRTGSINASNTGGIFGNVSGLSGKNIIINSALTDANTALVFSGSIYGTSNTGGLIGLATYTTLTTLGGNKAFTTTGAANPLYLMTISGTSNVGGLIGLLDTGSVFTRSGTLGTDQYVSVFGSGNNVAGLFGNVSNTVTTFAPTSVLSNVASVTMSDAGTGVGGIFGSFNLSNITLAFDMSNGGMITGSTATNGVGGVTGTMAGSAGNLITLTGNIMNCSVIHNT